MGKAMIVYIRYDTIRYDLKERKECPERDRSVVSRDSELVMMRALGASETGMKTRERSSEPATRASKLNREESRRRSGDKGHRGPNHRTAGGARRRRVLLRPVRLGGAGCGSTGAGRQCGGCGGDESDLGDEAGAGGADDGRGRLDERVIFGVVVVLVVVVVVVVRSRVLSSLDVCRTAGLVVSTRGDGTR